MKHVQTTEFARSLGACLSQRADGSAEPRRTLMVVAALTVLFSAQAVWSAGRSGEPPGRRETAGTTAAPNRNHLTVAVNQSRVIRLGARAARVSVANPEIADILVLDPQQVYVVGKRMGTTNVVLWDAKDRVRDNLLLEVTPDLDLLKARLHEVMPGEKVEVRSAQGTIVVSGAVSSPQRAQAAMELAKSFKGPDGGEPLNMVQVGGSQQVMLEVKVAEVSRDFGKTINGLVNANYRRADGIRFGTIGGGGNLGGSTTTNNAFGQSNRDVTNNTTTFSTVGQYAETATAIAGRGFFSQFASGNFLFTLALEAAKTNGQARILAEPNLTTLSGQEAKFLAGGQYPYTVAQPTTGSTVYTTEFKDYGIGLTFVPVVLDSGVINLKVNVSVSELDFTVQTPSGQPGLKTRNANSTVEVKTGESISIAGLINERMRENVSKFPGLGDIPVLGALFRSQEFTKNQSELVIFVTPRLARSIDPSQMKLPTAQFVAPTDVEFYLLGRTQGRNVQTGSGGAAGGGMGPDRSGTEGAYGHDL